jgi:hypothetical protein
MNTIRLSANGIRALKRTNKLCMHAHHSDHSVAVAVFANGTYFVNTPCIFASTSCFHIEIVLVLISILINKIHQMMTTEKLEHSIYKPVYTYLPEGSLV